ncbi:hypothetical protein OQH60_08570 [Campylobacter sp. MIT 21-1685]|uniref:hypothetical protein n=1 Tax=unclassified Campylobacter TaxID=2593542 RepID=UPI00224AAF79|nr:MULTISPECIES: hypothetical protein [unclassified Campylobacter]MCX2683909.1 hypothetical protein [Campylobacter sp. MIT 21-1684]MCX2752192.1 hypothetical protein [Campylobacter sp. MIT 21-1682]MCX2808387.1 hypothetical protein [Campylobacter sp. MIT 21-1685]
MKTSFKYSILIILTLLNIQFIYILTFLPFPFFGWITLFIFSCIWVYLFLRFCVWSINKIFKKNLRVKKIYLALPYPLIIGSWFAFSFVPLEWQPSFREFERLCREEGGDTTTIYNQEAYDRIRRGESKDIDIWEDKMVSWRIKEAVLKVYERNTNILIESYKTFVWYDIGMFAKNERTVTCAYIDETKQKIKERGY